MFDEMFVVLQELLNVIKLAPSNKVSKGQNVC